MITFGNNSISIGLIAAFLALWIIKLIPFAVAIWFSVQGFRVHWGWGLANLLIPVAIIPFCFLHFKESKKPLILAGTYLALFFLLLLLFAKHGRYFRPRVEVSPGLPASASNAVLDLKLVSGSELETISSRLSLKTTFVPLGISKDGHDEERLTAIRSDGFVIQFTIRNGGETQTNVISFPFGHTTETNAFGWMIIGNYGDNIETWPGNSAKPAADSTFRLLTPALLTNSSVGSGPAR